VAVRFASNAVFAELYKNKSATLDLGVMPLFTEKCKWNSAQACNTNMS